MLDERDLRSLKLHVDNLGTVWYSYGAGPVVNAECTLLEFLLLPISREVEHVRSIGCKNNVSAILAFYSLGLTNGKPSVEVCTPLVCGTRRILMIPELAIAAARMCDLVPSMGGWHTFSRLDYPSYALASMFERGTAIHDRVISLLQAHPAWKALSFIPHLDLYECARLLGLILDPRWYTDPANDSRSSKLNAFLGLCPRNQRFIREEKAIGPKPGIERCQLVWRVMGMDSPYDGSIDDPGYFLPRLWHQKQGDWKGALRTSQLFISYLRYNWIDAIYEGAGRLNDPLFIPEQFFKNADEAAAFRRHVCKFNESKQ